MGGRIKFSNEPADILARPAERLVVRGFRNWMAGYEHGDIQCWEQAWRDYSTLLGPRDGRLLLTELQYWVRILRQVTMREIQCLPHCCRYLAHDECMALSMISSHQHQDRGTAHAAAIYLCGQSGRDPLDLLSDASSSFAAALSNTGHHLLPVPGEVIEDIAQRAIKGTDQALIRH
ncbi:MAG: hypothetical protein AAGI06_05665 [Pseudomonadota bacterium]